MHGASSDSSSNSSDTAPIEVASHFYTAINEPKPTSIDFSLDGLHFVSAHGDDALRLIDVGALAHSDTITCESFGVHCVRFTQSSRVVCVAPRHPLDGHLHLLDVTTAQFVAALAYVDDAAGELTAMANVPVYSTVAQCPRSDVLAAVVAGDGRLALFHPLIAGAVAASGPRAIVGGTHACVRFAHDGHMLVVGDDDAVTVHDRRKLFAGALCRLRNRDVFRERGHTARCRGVDVSADGAHLLLTSSYGEAVVCDWQRQQQEQSQQHQAHGGVVCTYFHDDAASHFVGAGDAVAAQYMTPHVVGSPVAQPTSSMVAGRHLLVYAGYHANTTPDSNNNNDNDVRRAMTHAGAASRPHAGALLYELQSKDSDVPVALAVNPRYKVLAVAARSVTWWRYSL